MENQFQKIILEVIGIGFGLMNKVKPCPIHPKIGKLIYIKSKEAWKIKCKHCHSNFMRIK